MPKTDKTQKEKEEKFIASLPPTVQNHYRKKKSELRDLMKDYPKGVWYNKNEGVLNEAGIFRKKVKMTIHRKQKKMLAKLIQMYNKKIPAQNKIKVFLKLIQKNVNDVGDDLYEVTVESSGMSAAEDFITAIKRTDITAFQ